MIIKMDTHDITLLQFVSKDALFQQPRLTITNPGHQEGGMYFPAESVMVYGSAAIVKLYHFLGECVAEANLVKQGEFPFSLEIAKKNETVGEENDTEETADDGVDASLTEDV